MADDVFQNFTEIAKRVDGKSVSECVKYYYLTKKEARYRLRKRKIQKLQKSKKQKLIIEKIKEKKSETRSSDRLKICPAKVTCHCE